MIIASRVLKTRDSIETRVFKTRFTRFADSLTWKIFATWRFQTPLLIPSLSVFQTLSQSLKHSVSLSSTLNLWSTLSQSLKHSCSISEALSLAVKRSPSTASNAQTTFRRSPHPHSDDPLTHPLKSLKRSPSNARRQTLTVLGVQRNYRHCQTLSPFLRPHSDNPLSSNHIPTSLPTEVLILLCLKVCVSKKNLSFLNNDSI